MCKAIISNLLAGMLALGIILMTMGAGQAQTNAPAANLVNLQGVVENVGMGVGLEFPTFTLSLGTGGTATVITGPYYFLLDSGFEIGVGDRMAVVARPSLWHENTFVAVELTNLTTLQTLVLRAANGRPVWTNRGGPGQPGGPNGFPAGPGTRGNPGKGEGGPPEAGGPSIVDPTVMISIEGVVVRTDIAPGAQYPSFVLVRDDRVKVSIMTGPYHYLAEWDFRISIGDRIKALAFPSSWPDSSYVAVELTNVTTSKSITLRDAEGTPLWIGQGARNMGDCFGWLAPDGALAEVVTLRGVVVSVDMAPGQEFPTFSMLQADGSLVTVITGPYHLLLESGFDLRVGDEMLVLAIMSMWYPDTYAAAELKNLTTGDTLVLRDGAGRPNWAGSQQLADNGLGYGGGGAWFNSTGSNVEKIKGTVESVNFGFGQGYPSFTLVKSNGTRVAAMLGPLYFLNQHRFELQVGDQVRLWAFPSGWFDGVYVGMKVKNRTRGGTLSLRAENGQPLWTTIP